MKMNRSLALAGWLSFSVGCMGCGKSVQLQDVYQSTFSPPSGAKNPGNPSCPLSQVTQWSFVQPNQSLRNAVDFLFVLDHSSSMLSKISRLNAAVPAFLHSLSPGLDYRIGVMSAYGRTHILNSKNEGNFQIQSALRGALASEVERGKSTIGDALLYSLGQSLVEPQLSQIKNLGFYRPDAALSVVLITDKNDLCYPPNLYGYFQFPDFVPALVEHQKGAFQGLCLQKDGRSSKITPASTYSALKAVKGNEPVLLDAVIHMDPKRVPANHQESIGHGVLELVQNDPQNIIRDISDLDDPFALVGIGERASNHLQLQTQFYLDGRFELVPGSLSITVAGKSVGFEFNSDTRVVSIGSQDAGQSQSVVEITACQATP